MHVPRKFCRNPNLLHVLAVISARGVQLSVCCSLEEYCRTLLQPIWREGSRHRLVFTQLFARTPSMLFSALKRTQQYTNRHTCPLRRVHEVAEEANGTGRAEKHRKYINLGGESHGTAGCVMGDPPAYYNRSTVNAIHTRRICTMCVHARTRNTE